MSLDALVQEGSLRIDRWHEMTPDKAFADSHYYSDKTPGTAAVALPACAASVAVAPVRSDDIDSKTGWLVTRWV